METTEFNLPPSHPVLAQLWIDPVRWYDLQRLDAGNPATQIIDHDVKGDRLVVFVACVADEVRQALEDAWG